MPFLLRKKRCILAAGLSLLFFMAVTAGAEECEVGWVECGRSVAGPGDLNGDGIPDLLVGAPDFAFNYGGARLLSGKTGKVLYTFRGDKLQRLIEAKKK